MSDLQLGDLAAWVAAAIATGAAIVAMVQAHHARKSREAAEKQADAAQDQAQSAATQAAAASAQVEIMLADRADRRQPTFTIVEAASSELEVGAFSAKIVVRMASGPSLELVKVVLSGQYVGEVFDPSPYAEGPGDTFTKVRPGGTLTFYVQCEDGYVGSLASVDFECVEDGEERRTWRPGLGFTIAQPSGGPRVRWMGQAAHD